eukprot:123506_1
MAVYILVTSVLCLLFMMLFSVHHIRRQQNWDQKRKKARSKAVSMTIGRDKTGGCHAFLPFLNYYVIFGYIFHVIFLIGTTAESLSNQHHYTDKDCRLKWNLMAFSVHLTKFNLYLLFITRIYNAFLDSAYGYSRRTLIALYIYIIVYLIIATFNDFYFLDGAMDETNHICEPIIPFVSMISTLFFDLSLSILSVFLFARPLYKLMRVASFSDHRFTNLIIKKCTLVSIALASTMIVVLVLFTTSVVLLQIHDVINIVCIAMMAQVEHKLYEKTCGRVCHKHVALLLGSTSGFAKQLINNLEASQVSTTVKSKTPVISTTKTMQSSDKQSSRKLRIAVVPEPSIDFDESVTSRPDPMRDSTPGHGANDSISAIQRPHEPSPSPGAFDMRNMVQLPAIGQDDSTAPRDQTPSPSPQADDVDVLVVVESSDATEKQNNDTNTQTDS